MRTPASSPRAARRSTAAAVLAHRVADALLLQPPLDEQPLRLLLEPPEVGRDEDEQQLRAVLRQVLLHAEDEAGGAACSTASAFSLPSAIRRSSE